MTNGTQGEEKKIVRFQKHLAEKTKQEAVESEGENAVEGFPVCSPKKKGWVMIQGKSIDDLLPVHTVKILDPDGEEEEYIVQIEDKQTRQKVFDMCEDHYLKLCAQCANTLGENFIWLVSCNIKNKNPLVAHTTGKLCVQKAQKSWHKIKWKGNSVGWKAWTPFNVEKYNKIEAEFSKLDVEDIINIAFDNRIITDLSHDALERVQGK